MNGRLVRLLCGVAIALAGSGAAASEMTGMVSDGAGSINYRLFEPSATASGSKLPLVLFLHGAGERGTDNIAQTTHIGGLLSATSSGQYASYVLAPQIDSNSWFQSFGSK